MSSLNKVYLLGNLALDPELRIMTNGMQFCRIRVANTRKYKSESAENGVKQETLFVDVEAFGRLAETVSSAFKKGSPIFIEGRLRRNEWVTKDNEKRNSIVVVMENFARINSDNENNFQKNT